MSNEFSQKTKHREVSGTRPGMHTKKQLTDKEVNEIRLSNEQTPFISDAWIHECHYTCEEYPEVVCNCGRKEVLNKLHSIQALVDAAKPFLSSHTSCCGDDCGKCDECKLKAALEGVEGK